MKKNNFESYADDLYDMTLSSLAKEYDMTGVPHPYTVAAIFLLAIPIGVAILLLVR